MSKFSTVQKIYHSIVPYTIRRLFIPLFTKLHRKVLYKKIVTFLEKESTLTEEERRILEHLKKNGLSTFPGSYQDKYRQLPVKIFVDKGSGLKYVIHKGNRLFFKRDMSEERITKMYRGINIEQDPLSPHRYLTKEFNIADGDVVAEVGAAEASFSLEAVDKASKIHIFETDPLWIEALELTFKPWEDKVTIFNYFVSSQSSGKKISLDDFIKNHGTIDFLKVDVDGEEMNLLKGADNFISETMKPPKISICTYHNQNDEREFKEYFGHRNYTCEMSNGYMLFIFDKNLTQPYLRRGVLRAYKNNG